jgi:ribosomal subunit interface protein
MNISMRAKDAALMTEDLKDFTEKKVLTLQRLVGDAADVKVDFSKETSNHHKNGELYRVGIEINTHGERFFTEESSEDFKTSVNRVKEELKKQITAKKGAKETKLRNESKIIRDLKETT